MNCIVLLSSDPKSLFSFVNYGNNNTAIALMHSPKVAVIGGGPVGLLGCLLLERFGLDYICFERSQKLRSHPSAHWVSARSKQILSQVDSLCERIDEEQETFEHFKYYRYCESVGGREMGKSNHFLPSIQEKLNSSYKYFGQFPNHISQSRLLNIEFEALRGKERIMLGQNITSIEKENDEYLLKNSKKEVIGRSKYVILSNGFHSELRNQLGIKAGGGKEFYKLVNIHFKSIRLAKAIKAKQAEAMLHFVYNDKIPCVLVNHSLETGQFVLQIPNYQPFVDLLQVYTPVQLIQTAINEEDWSNVQNDLQIIHVGRWKLQAQLADRMSHQNIFLAGDTAHTYTPAGGFGMNCGFQDINQLVHTLHLLERNPQADRNKVITMYNVDRLNANQKYLQQSLRNYKLTDQIANQLGFPSQLTEYFFSFCRLLPQMPFSTAMGMGEKMRLLAMKGLFKPKQLEPKLDLFFDQFDFKVQRLSSSLPEIIQSIKKGQCYDAWVDRSVSSSQINEIFGELKEQNILRTSLANDEKIVRRDGIVVK